MAEKYERGLGAEMNAIEEIRHAIAKLERLKADSTQGPWWAFENVAPGAEFSLDDDIPTIGGSIVHVTDIPQEGGHLTYTVAEVTAQADARLIEALHRSLDAQVSMLRFASDGLYDLDEFVALARAINGREL